MASDPRCKGAYDAADITMTLLEDLKDKSGKKVLFESGLVLGHSTSDSSFKDFRRFWQKLKKKGLVGEVVRCRLGYEMIEGKSNGYVWGITKFRLADET